MSKVGFRAGAVGLLWLSSAALSSYAAASEETWPPREAWIELFNGVDLSGWIPKVAKHPLGENYAGTFRVENGVLKVAYDGYRDFDGRFGHLFHEKPFSYYRLIVEYRFTGEQAPGGPGAWAVRNSGVMLHAQHPASMGVDQSFPISVEAQFLGGLGDGTRRPTANVCTPGTHIVHAARIHPEHCLASSSATYEGDGWVQVEVIVLGASQFTHRVNGETVLTYALAQIGGEGAETLAKSQHGALLERGYIALQSESHPIEFRRVELLDLEGCLDPESASYRSYYVKSKPEACAHASGR